MFRSYHILVPATAFLLLGIPFVAGYHKADPPKPATATYVGQESCMSSGCHNDKYGDGHSYAGAAAFRQTFHQKIHLRPTPQTVVIDSWFSRDTVLSYTDPTYPDTLLIHLSKGAGPNDYYVDMKLTPSGDTTPKMKVAYTYGGSGWMQRYLVQVNGIHYVIPFQYVYPAYRQRDDKNGRAYFLDIHRWVSKSTFRFFPQNSNAFRALSWDKNCVACHVNGYDNKLIINGADSIWQATWPGVLSGDSALKDQNIKIGCESCHGPGSEHVANPTKANVVSPSTWGKDSVSTDLKYDLCNQCHTRISSTGKLHNFPYKDSTSEHYTPGTPLAPFIFNPFSAAQTWGDGKTSYAHHQQGQDIKYSKPYSKHAWVDACWHCHETHKDGPGGLPFQLKENFYSMDSGKGCVNCHEGKQDTIYSPIVKKVVNNHSQHPQAISQCVNCHFPKLASIGFAFGPDVSVHGFNTLRPTLTRTYQNQGVGFLGQPNVCASACHRNGVGNRNNKPGDPPAPSYGISDNTLFVWKEAEDVRLADSLWEGYKRLYPFYVSAVRESGSVALKTSLLGIYPNPATDAATIRFGVGRAGNVQVTIYDMTGGLVRVLVDARLESGVYSEVWKCTDEYSQSVPNGTYLVKVTGPQGADTRKIVVAR